MNRKQLKKAYEYATKGSAYSRMQGHRYILAQTGKEVPLTRPAVLSLARIATARDIATTDSRPQVRATWRTIWRNELRMAREARA